MSYQKANQLSAEDFGPRAVAFGIRHDRKGEKPRFGRFGGVRQWIEPVIDTLKGPLGLEHHGARTIEGLYARVASKLLALSSGIWHN